MDLATCARQYGKTQIFDRRDTKETDLLQMTDFEYSTVILVHRVWSTCGLETSIPHLVEQTRQ